MDDEAKIIPAEAPQAKPIDGTADNTEDVIPQGGRIYYEIALKVPAALEVYLLRVPFYTYNPLTNDDALNLWELIKNYFAAGSTDRIDAALELIGPGEPDYRLILDKADISFQWLSEEEQAAAIKTLRNSVTQRRSRNIRKRNSTKTKTGGQAKRR